jgi:pimeloyl-ACP methyl ester carboxylesterase
LLDAARDGEAQAYAMITAWSFAPAHRFGGNRQPGVWMTGNALRLMQRSSQGVLRVDLVACNSYADGIDAAEGIRCPTLLVLGACDSMAPPRSAQRLVATLKTPRVVTLPGCGHSLMAEAPDAVLDALRGIV